MIKSKAFMVLILVTLVPVFLKAQLNHFIYLQTENKQPFYARLDKKILSSSASGYLIIPKLKDGQYNITIGFPKGEKGEQAFTCAVENKDAGYLIRSFGEKGWGLFNLQTMDVVMAGTGTAKTTAVVKDKPDEFSSMLSDAVNDPAIRQIKKEDTMEKQVEPVAGESVAQKEKGKEKVMIIKRELVTDQSGVKALYIDQQGEKPDTIDVFIPVETALEIPKEKPVELQKDVAADPPPAENKTVPDNGNEKPVSPPVEAVIKQESGQTGSEKTDAKFLPIEVQAAGNTVEEIKKDGPVQMVNSDCKSIAGDDDFMKLRKKMAGEDSEEAMLSVARKSFKSKCYTTEQVRNLAVLFLKDPGKYQFFDLAYQYVSDSSSFNTLEALLSDPYYISRFKAMLRH